MLYPHKLLPGFLEKNIISRRDLSRSAFLMNEVSRGNREIVEEDSNGNYHFNGTIGNAAALRMKLNGMDDLQEDEKETICNIYIECFDHKHFTGRSGTFYKYEGIGCIYWHMVSKLLVAVQEVYMNTFANEPDSEFLSGLELHYNQIKDGIGLKKPPDKYGAFPTDPYSHTPGFGGVQQPGMTGQVKEDIITRFGELGLVIENGCIHFTPRLLLKSEFF